MNNSPEATRMKVIQYLAINTNLTEDQCLDLCEEFKEIILHGIKMRSFTHYVASQVIQKAEENQVLPDTFEWTNFEEEDEEEDTEEIEDDADGFFEDDEEDENDTFEEEDDEDLDDWEDEDDDDDDDEDDDDDD